MYIITDGTKETICQALNKWVCELDEIINELKKDEKKGIEIPKAVFGRFNEGRAQIKNISEQFEKICDLHFVCVDDEQFENLIDYECSEIKEI